MSLRRRITVGQEFDYNIHCSSNQVLDETKIHLDPLYMKVMSQSWSLALQGTLHLLGFLLVQYENNPACGYRVLGWTKG